MLLPERSNNHHGHENQKRQRNDPSSSFGIHRCSVTTALLGWRGRYDRRVPEQQNPKRSRPGLLSAEQVTPLDLDAVNTLRVGTLLWFIAFLALLPFTERLSDSDRGWWIWTCVAGVALGGMGMVFTMRRRERIRHERSASDPG